MPDERRADAAEDPAERRHREGVLARAGRRRCAAELTSVGAHVGDARRARSCRSLLLVLLSFIHAAVSTPLATSRPPRRRRRPSTRATLRIGNGVVRASSSGLRRTPARARSSCSCSLPERRRSTCCGARVEARDAHGDRVRRRRRRRRARRRPRASPSRRRRPGPRRRPCPRARRACRRAPLPVSLPNRRAAICAERLVARVLQVVACSVSVASCVALAARPEVHVGGDLAGLPFLRAIVPHT